MSIKIGNEISDKDKIAFYNIFPSEIPYIEYGKVVGIEKSIRDRSEKIIGGYNLTGAVDSIWDTEGMQALFLKGFNPAASVYILATVKLIVASLKDVVNSSGRVFGLELGSGAGWATVILWKELQNKGYKNATLFSADSSPYAVATTVLLLEYFNIPYQIVRGELSDKQKMFDGVVVQLDDFTDALDQHKENSLHFSYSNHGVAYLTESDYDVILKKLESKLCKKASFVTDSLDSNKRLVLNKVKVILKVVAGRNVEKDSDVTVMSRTNGDKTEITWLYRLPERMFLDWLHYLMFKNFLVFKGYMRALSKSEETQQKLFSTVGVPSTSLYTGKRELSGLKPYPLPSHVIDQLPPFVLSAWLKKE